MQGASMGAGERERSLERLVRWMGIDSTSGAEGAYLEVLEGDLSGLGFACSRQAVAPGRWNLIARRSGEVEVLFCTHVDTVPPYLPPRVEGEAVWGRGACDTKGVLAAMVAAWERLAASDAAAAERVGFLLVVGEEVDHCGAAAAAGLALRPRRILLGEPTESCVAVGQKGILKVRVCGHGVAGHSAYPEGKASANHGLVEGLWRVLEARWPEDEALGATTVNVGTVRGGVAANVIAEAAEAEALFRTVSDEGALWSQVEATLSGVGGVTVERVMSSASQRFEAPSGYPTCVVPFNSDAAWLKALGPVWLVGPGDIRLAHSEEERITLGEIGLGIATYARLAGEVLGCASGD